jgi:hypothetical protein
VCVPARHVVELEGRLVYTTFSGIVTLDDVVRLIASLRADPQFDSEFSEIVDLSNASDVRLGYDEFKRLEELDPFSEGSKRAFVIPTNPAVYGVTRMYHLIQNEDPSIKIFRSEQEAREWIRNTA